MFQETVWNDELGFTAANSGERARIPGWASKLNQVDWNRFKGVFNEGKQIIKRAKTPKTPSWLPAEAEPQVPQAPQVIDYGQPEMPMTAPPQRPVNAGANLGFDADGNLQLGGNFSLSPTMLLVGGVVVWALFMTPPGKKKGG